MGTPRSSGTASLPSSQRFHCARRCSACWLGGVHRCLQDKKSAKDFGKSCREEIESYESEISKDYRLNFRLNKACTKDVTTLCPGLCTQNDGSVRFGLNCCTFPR